MSVPVLARSRRSADPVIVTTRDPSHLTGEGGIRCPLCDWRPSAASRWCCECIGTPEPYFEACGTVWHTFTTRGRCPGCQHQWQWTTCLSCGVASPHEDWYFEEAPPG
jgi:hypothetical protein